ncbi:hypothetical protein Psfp_03888 [Pelotomaculum sp. FP]|uniref:hypothetical protein n=1 Tax=Pelotomaculum sp. FP TaxID=261474 RepID=UPI00106651CE|nr:hypothetical protein [Pelotomaculum sp. FP]TEB11759.1 hypothetical protein Psfp_03888 [Pelotomaculum sp. FP]
MGLNLSKNTVQLCTIDQIKRSAQKQKEIIYIHPAQDFVKGLMWYGIKLLDDSLIMRDYIINSDKQYIPLFVQEGVNIDEDDEDKVIKIDYLKENNIVVPFRNLSYSNFSSDGIIRFIDGNNPLPLEIHNKIKNILRTYIYFEDENIYNLIPCWIMGTYLFMCFRTYPYLHFQGEKASGKTTLFNVVSPLCFNSLSSSNISKASFYRDIEINKSTMLVDEFEKFQDTLEGEFISILNSGYKKDSYVIRCEEKKKEYLPKKFSMYSPKMFAGINDVYDVLNDRCIRINMYKLNKNTKIKYLKITDKIDNYFKELRDDLYIFGLNYAKQVYKTYTKEAMKNYKPSALSPREWELWEPIYILAHTVSDDVLKSIIKLSSVSSDQRKDDDIERNFTYKFVKCFIETVKGMTPIEDQLGMTYYDRNDLLNNIKLDDEDFSLFFKKMNTFTRYLKSKLNIKEIDHPFTREKKTIKTIGIPDGFLNSLAEQYNLTSKLSTEAKKFTDDKGTSDHLWFLHTKDKENQRPQVVEAVPEVSEILVNSGSPINPDVNQIL